MAPVAIVLGLGNPGERYRATRHNVGYRVIDVLAAAAGATLDRTCATARFTLAPSGPGSYVLALPRTYMNRVGLAATELCGIHGLPPERLLVVYDDVELVLGRIRVRPGGGAAGHNGVRSVIAELGTERFPRVRVGVRGATRDASELADYVLSPFDSAECAGSRRSVELAAAAVGIWLDEGIVAAMNRCNGPGQPDGPADPDPAAPEPPGRTQPG